MLLSIPHTLWSVIVIHQIVSAYYYCLLQIINCNNTAIDFKTTINSGAIQGVSDGNISSSLNYFDAMGTELLTGAPSINNGGTDSIWRFDVIGRYLKIEALVPNLNANTKILIMLAKIS
jgi:hypothetical protein